MSLSRLRAPSEEGGVLAAPPLEQAGSLLDRNRQELGAASVQVLGKPLPELRRLARDNTWDAVRHYLSEANEPVPERPTAGQAWILAGHQPELFHPGVWVKNFALHGLGRRHAAFALNLVVDNDAARAPILHVPAGTHVASLPFDRWQAESPYEERRVLDEELFASLPARLAPHTKHWPFAPLLPDYWLEVMQQASATPLLGERLVRARRALERRWGCLQAEVPLSGVCQTEAFAWFACHLLLHADELRRAYNAAVHDYRRRYGLRNAYHPVPDLVQEGDWCEVPLWAWQAGRGRRARLFVRRSGPAELQLRAGETPWPPLALGGEPSRLVGQWLDLARRGLKVRTRALTTTLFARICLGDLFVHGIGGGKYDELTDVLIRDLFGLAAPAFLVLSATLRLPLPRLRASGEQCRRLARTFRDVWYNPQRHFPGGNVPEPAQTLAAEKAAWVAREPTSRPERRERFEKLRALNERLRTFLNGTTTALRQARDECRAELQVNEVLGRRDYSFCLFPESLLRDFYQRFV